MSDTEYTPTLEEVKGAWEAWHEFGDDRWTPAQFDRWLAAYTAGVEARVREERELIGWLVLDKDTLALDWDGELHDTEEQARASLTNDAKYHDADWRPFDLYDIVPVFSAIRGGSHE